MAKRPVPLYDFKAFGAVIYLFIAHFLFTLHVVYAIMQKESQ